MSLNISPSYLIRNDTVEKALLGLVLHWNCRRSSVSSVDGSFLVMPELRHRCSLNFTTPILKFPVTFASANLFCASWLIWSLRLTYLRTTAARLITGTRRRDHITLVLRDLHWLPVWRRVDYKLALPVCKSLHGLAPFYLADDCILASSSKYRHRLRSADVDTCIVPRTRTRFGDRSFPASGPRIWNSLPPEMRRPDTELDEFRRLLKTFLFA